MTTKESILTKIIGSDGKLRKAFCLAKSIQKNFTEEEIKLLNETRGDTLSEKFWVLLNNLEGIPRPTCRICGSLVSFRSFGEGGYAHTCGNKICVAANARTLGAKLHTKEDIAKKKSSTFKENHDGLNAGEYMHLKHKDDYVSPFTNKEVQEKAQLTKKEKYGDWGQYVSEKLANMSEEAHTEWRDKIKATCVEKYGQPYPIRDLATTGGLHKSFYIIDDYCFDSSWEATVYLYYSKVLHKQIERNTAVFFSYVGADGRQHKYFPDLYLKDENRFIEVKGDHLLNDESFIKYKLPIIQKYSMLLITGKEIGPMRNVVFRTFGKKVLNQYKVGKDLSKWKRRTIDITSIEDIDTVGFRWRNKNVKFKYTCLQCKSEVMVGWTVLSHFRDCLCKKCRTKN